MSISEIIPETSLAISAFSVLALFVTVLLMWKQTRSIKQTLSYNTVHLLYSANIEVSRIFLSSPELRPYFYDGKLYNNSDSNFASKLATSSEMMLDLFESVVVHLRMHSNDHQIKDLKVHWDSYIEQVFKNSPIICQHFDDNKSWYVDELHLIRNKLIS